MVLKAISSKAIIAHVYRNFNITHSGWVVDAIEWIGEALGFIGHGITLKRDIIECKVENYRCRIPCNAEQLIHIEYCNRKLAPLQGARGIRRAGGKTTGGTWYYLNDSYINTSFETGTLFVHAMILPLDYDGYPLVPDSSQHKEACGWFILRNLLARGYPHPVFDWKMANAEWLKYMAKAQNKAKMPDLATSERIKNMWTGYAIDANAAERFFEGRFSSQMDSTEYTKFEDLERTIIHIEDEDSDLQLSNDL